MPNTYTQIHIQAVFAVKGRASLITPGWKGEWHKYITGIIQNHGHKVLQINSMPDHIHILIGLRPTQSLADLMQQVKQDSSKWVDQRGFLRGKFSWQAGYGAFSYSKQDVPTVIKYIQQQEEHHRSIKFQDEYLKMLREQNIDFDERYIFKPIE